MSRNYFYRNRKYFEVNVLNIQFYIDGFFFQEYMQIFRTQLVADKNGFLVYNFAIPHCIQENLYNIGMRFFLFVSVYL